MGITFLITRKLINKRIFDSEGGLEPEWTSSSRADLESSTEKE